MLAMGAPWLNTKMVVAVSPGHRYRRRPRCLSRDGDARRSGARHRGRAAYPRIAVRSVRLPIEGQEPHRLVGKIGIDATAKARHNIKDFERAWPVNWGKVRLEDYL